MQLPNFVKKKSNRNRPKEPEHATGPFKRDKNKYLWSKETTPGPVVGVVATLYTTSKRAMDSIKLEEQRILVDIEKKTKIKLNSLDVQIENNQQ